MDCSLPLHVLIFPFLAQGHAIPSIDLAKLFASRSVKVTILTTPGNFPSFQPPITRANQLGSFLYPIQISLIPFPTIPSLPQGCENMASVPQHQKYLFFEAMSMFKQPFQTIVKDMHPDCIVAGLFLPWIHNIASELNIPSLDFHGSNFSSKCMADSVERHKVLENLPEDTSTVVLPNLPHRIEIHRGLIPDSKKVASSIAKLLQDRKEAEKISYGAIMNSFYEMETEYVEYFRKVIGKRAWHVGPMLLWNDEKVDKFHRGGKSTVEEGSCMGWLGSKSHGSVLYVCFGSASFFTGKQLHEIAVGLERSGHDFVWVVKDGGCGEWMPEGFEERVGGRGLVIPGWAPQVLILNHESTGGYLTHCGWNSILEGVSAGLPFATWPLFAEQTYNERLIVDVLRIGVAVGVKDYSLNPEERTVVEAGVIESAVKELMGGEEEAEERKRRAKELGAMARKAVREEGSSYESMSSLIRELEDLRKNPSFGDSRVETL